MERKFTTFRYFNVTFTTDFDIIRTDYYVLAISITCICKCKIFALDPCQ